MTLNTLDTTGGNPPEFPGVSVPGLSLRVVTREGEPWFFAKDVCGALGLINTSKALEHVDPEDKHNHSLGLAGKPPLVVNESGLYSLILKSRKPEAKAFKRWVTSEVLPSVRKTGGYMTPAVAQTTTTNP